MGVFIMLHYMIYTQNNRTKVSANNPRDAIKVFLNTNDLIIMPLKTKDGANFVVELIDSKRKSSNYYNVQHNQGNQAIYRNARRETDWQTKQSNIGCILLMSRG